MYKLYKIYTYVCIHTSISVMKDIYLYIYIKLLYIENILYIKLQRSKENLMDASHIPYSGPCT